MTCLDSRHPSSKLTYRNLQLAPGPSVPVFPGQSRFLRVHPGKITMSPAARDAHLPLFVLCPAFVSCFIVRCRIFETSLKHNEFERLTGARFSALHYLFPLGDLSLRTPLMLMLSHSRRHPFTAPFPLTRFSGRLSQVFRSAHIWSHCWSSPEENSHKFLNAFFDVFLINENDLKVVSYNYF